MYDFVDIGWLEYEKKYHPDTLIVGTAYESSDKTAVTNNGHP